MAEFSKQESVGGTEVKMNHDNCCTSQEQDTQGKQDFFVLDMESFSLSNDNNKNNNTELNPFVVDSTNSPQLTLKLQKSLSRKGSSFGAQRKISNGPNNTSHHGVPSPLIVVSSTVADGELLPSSCRRRRESAPPWLNPRKVLFFFATVSCMGTIVLLYFTLSMNQMDGRDANAK